VKRTRVLRSPHLDQKLTSRKKFTSLKKPLALKDSQKSLLKDTSPVFKSSLDHDPRTRCYFWGTNYHVRSLDWIKSGLVRNSNRENLKGVVGTNKNIASEGNDPLGPKTVAWEPHGDPALDKNTASERSALFLIANKNLTPTRSHPLSSSNRLALQQTEGEPIIAEDTSVQKQ